MSGETTTGLLQAEAAPPTLATAQILSGLHYPDDFWLSGDLTYSIPGTNSSWNTASYATGSEPFRTGFSVLNATEAANFRLAMAEWDKLIPQSFVETNDQTNTGNIRVAFTAITDQNVWGYATPAPANGQISTAKQGDIWIDNSIVGKTLAKGTYDFEAAMHEIGHTLGLKHPFEAPLLPTLYDNDYYTIMSYTRPNHTQVVFTRSGSNLNVNYNAVYTTTPMVLDIAAIQAVYGRDLTTASGDDTYTFQDSTPFLYTIYDAGGINTFDLSSVTRGSVVDIRPGAYSSIGQYTRAQQIADVIAANPGFSTSFITNSVNTISDSDLYTWSNNVGIAFSTIIWNVKGSKGADTIIGNDYINLIYGGAGNDTIFGGGGSGGIAGYENAGDYLAGEAGDDTIEGDAGDDSIDGGDGVDTAVYTSASSNYSVTRISATDWKVTDLRAGGEGADELFFVEKVRFTDKTMSLTPTLPAAVDTAFTNITRAVSNADQNYPLAITLSDKFAVSGTTNALAIQDIVKAAGASTSVATLSYEFFTGKIPSAGGMDYLVSPTGPNPNNIDGPYYQSFSLENRYINFAVNLGKLGEGNAAFTAAYGAKTLFDATRDAYLKIFGSTPTDTKLHALLDPTFVLNGVTMSRADYFNYYGQDGANGIGTKAAMVGWLLSEAVKADVGTYAKSNDAFLTDLADGATFAVDMVAVYGKPEFVFTG